MIRVNLSVVIALLFSTAVSAQDRDSEHARKTLEIYTNIIEMETAKNLGNVPAMARYLADEMIGAGLPRGGHRNTGGWRNSRIDREIPG